jgi:hypothetical protein
VRARSPSKKSGEGKISLNDINLVNPGLGDEMKNLTVR